MNTFPINYRELYKPFDKELINIIGISWFDAWQRFHEIGNSPGIYPDTALLFVKMIKNIGYNFNINNVIEFGSGISTLFLSKICELKGIKFTSYEEDPKYMPLTLSLLKKYNIKDYENIVKPIINMISPTEKDIESFKRVIDNIDFNVDLIFLDSYGYSRNLLLENSQVKKIPFIIYDDAESSYIIGKFIAESKRYHSYFYDRVGRIDRQQFISYLDNALNFANYVNKYIPCIGTW